MEFGRLWVLVFLPIPVAVEVWKTSRAAVSFRPVFAAVLRALVYVLLLVALSSPRLIKSTGSPSVVFLCDVSESIPDLEHVEELVTRARDSLPESVQVRVVQFAGSVVSSGADAGSAQAVSLRRFDRATGMQTRIGASVEFSAALLSAARGGVLVLVSDGRDTGRTDPSDAVLRAAENGIRTFALEAVEKTPKDFAVGRVFCPASVRRKLRFTIQAELTAPAFAVAKVVCRRVSSGSGGGGFVGSTETGFGRGGRARVAFADVLSSGGFHTYAVEISGEGDEVPANDTAFCATHCEGEAIVLVSGGGMTVVRDALRGALSPGGFRVKTAQVLTAEDIGKALVTVLVGLPRKNIGGEVERALATAVLDRGAGMVVIGGARSLGAGGWRDGGTLEELLPLSMTPPPSQSSLLVVVLDKSGSMGRPAHPASLPARAGRTRLEFVTAAVQALVTSLDEKQDSGTRMVVVAFDARAELVGSYAVGSGRDAKETLRSALHSLTAGRGTNIVAGLEAAGRIVMEDRAQRRHVILLSDGDPEGGAGEAGAKRDAALGSIVEKLRKDGCTLSVVGTGPATSGRDRKLLASLADAGGGRAFFKEDVYELSEVLQSEIEEALPEYYQDRRFAAIEPWPPRMPGLPARLPPLQGVNRTRAKEDALLALLAKRLPDVARRPLESVPAVRGVRAETLPLLAVWRAGLGRVAVFATSRANVTSSPKHVQALQVLVEYVASTCTPAEGQTWKLSVDAGKLVLSVTDSSGAPVGGFRPQAELLPVGFQGEPRSFAMFQVGLGLYECEIPRRSTEGLVLPASAADYLGRAEVAGIRDETGAERARIVIDSMDRTELERLGSVPDVLDGLARIGGGRLLARPEDLGTELRDDVPGTTKINLTGVFALAAAAFFVVGLAARRFGLFAVIQ